MNQSNDTDAIRSDIDETRRRMDGTMDALADRLKPQHLLDEALGLLRRSSEGGEDRLHQFKEKLTHSADTAMHSVADTVKKNPLPALLIGAGIAWMIYGNRRSSDSKQYGDGDFYGYDREGDLRPDPGIYSDRPLEYPPPTGDSGDAGGSKMGEIKEKIASKAAGATEKAKEKLSHAGEMAREKASVLRERAGEKFTQMKQRTGYAYEQTRERMSSTATQHPLETGLVCLATGLIVGLALPTPNAVNRCIGPTVDRLRDRSREAGREMMAKGRRVAEAAATAVKEEAKAQGLTPEHMREQAGAIAASDRQAASESIRQENAAGQASQSGP